MILNELSKYYQRLLDDPEIEICEPGFSPEKISFRIVITKDGKFVNLEDLREKDDKNNLRPLTMNVPKFDGKRANGIKPYFLWDKSHYTIGVKLDEESEIETKEHHKAFLELFDEVLGNDYSNYISASAIKAFISTDDETNLLKKHENYIDFLNAFAVFEVQGTGFSTVFDDESILEKWREHYAKSATGKEMEQGLCLVSGEYGSLTTTHPTIKRGIGGKNDIPLVSCNISSGESYKKVKGQNAPVSSMQAAYFTGALNYLVDHNDHNILMGDTRVLYWAEENKKSESFFSAVCDLQKRNESIIKEVEATFKSLRSGIMPPDFEDESKFFVLGLSPNSARASVRFWQNDTVESMVLKLSRHIEDLSIIKMFPEKETDIPSIWQLLIETAALHDSKNILPTLAGPLMRAIMLNLPYPNNILSLLIGRIRNDQDNKSKGRWKIGSYRAAFIKAILNRNYNKELTVALDTERTSMPYSLGRLFAVLEKVQEDSADGEINATIKDRYFSAASATPKVVFPTVLKLSQNHQKKLRAKNPGMMVNREKLIGGIMNNLDDFPATLRLEEQGEFTIGYYHQRQDFFTKKEDRE